VNQLQRVNELLEAQMKSLKTVVVDGERRQAPATDVKQVSDERDLEMKRQLNAIFELKQQVIAFVMPELSSSLYNGSVVAAYDA